MNRPPNQFSQVFFMFTSQVCPPGHIVFELNLFVLHLLLQEFHTLSVTHFLILTGQQILQILQLALLHPFIKEGQVSLVVSETVLDAELNIVFSQLHTVMNVPKGYFWFDHPEFSQVFLGVANFCPECRTKGIHIAHGTTIVLHCQLPTHCQIGWFFEELLFKVDGGLVLFGGNVVDVFVKDGGYLEHVASPFTVTSSDDGSVYINEPSGLVEQVSGHNTTVPHPSHCPY